MGKNQKEKQYRINNEIIGYSTVRVVYKKNHNDECDEDFVKVVTLQEAKKMSECMGMDLVEINASANPPVVKICDYSKFLYEMKKAAKNKTKNTTKLKEISLTANISTHDMETKAKKVREFVSEGNKVKISLFLKGREVSRREELKKSLYLFIEMVEEDAVPESMPKDEGNRSIVILKQKKK